MEKIKEIKERISAMGESDLYKVMEKFLGMKDSEESYATSLYELANSFAEDKVTGDSRRRIFSLYFEESMYSTRGSYREGFIDAVYSVLF